jgi:(1->4)-alpha-D-glucan 1-alpha-D-glucosylmutase
VAAPRSTYRLQLNPEFTFREAAALVPYLAQLGVTHVYCSPILQARGGSEHGYDVVDHSRLSEDLGGRDGWDRLVAAARAHGLGVVADVVPNHMATDPANRRWMGLLAGGRESDEALWFDIDWDAQQGRVLVPVLGEPLAEAPVERDGDVVRYYEHSYPASEHYRLAFWRLGGEELNYRRFFDVTELVAVRVEEPRVFHDTHAVLLELIARGELDGLRIDHPDGLADPVGYTDKLAKESGGAWVVIEKILEPGEALTADWACAGTTGYDALRRIGGVLLDPDGGEPLRDFYVELTGMPRDFQQVVLDAKRDVVRNVLAAEVSRLTRVAYAVGRERRLDLSARGLAEALAELLVHFEVYRDYGPPWAYLDAALAAAGPALPRRGRELAFVGDLAKEPGEFGVRLQQTCGPVMAKGVEDTAFYRWFRLASLNEVGGSPGLFGVTVGDFHRDNEVMQRDWPLSMTTLSTHDTKRSEDVRARLAVLSELPQEWAHAVTRWRAARSFGDPNLEYLFWQTLIGAWPLDAARARAYLEKASREAKLRTSWTDPDLAYDAARDGFVDAVFADRDLLAAVGAWVAEHLEAPGRSNVLAQKLLQLAMPGVPDVYQGNEASDLSLVDPDNRRPVDFDARRRLLADVGAGPPTSLDGEKVLVTAATLRTRRDTPEAFGERGGYAALTATGDRAEHLVGFARGKRVAALATRLPVRLARLGGWGETAVALPGGQWRDELTGSSYAAPVRLADVFGMLPVALLVRE